MAECNQRGFKDEMKIAMEYIAKINSEYAPKDYHGMWLVSREYDVMVALEKIVGKPIPPVSEVVEETFGFVAEDTQVLKLGLSNMGLSSIPETISRLKKMQILILNNNNLMKISETIGMLENLRIMHADKNQLTSVPETIGQLTNLEKLFLYNNKLTTIPETIGQLKNLKLLALWNNKLTTIPETISNLTNLEGLFLLFNELKSLPRTIGKLTNLKRLALWNNQLTSLVRRRKACTRNAEKGSSLGRRMVTTRTPAQKTSAPKHAW
ncbi:MAG: leucine-rich repeat domain-containing protein, partial [Promethearchaeota archaeon]